MHILFASNRHESVEIGENDSGKCFVTNLYEICGGAGIRTQSLHLQSDMLSTGLMMIIKSTGYQLGYWILSF